MKDIKNDIRSLIRRQTELEVYDIPRVEKLEMSCDKNR